MSPYNLPYIFTIGVKSLSMSSDFSPSLIYSILYSDQQPWHHFLLHKSKRKWASPFSGQIFISENDKSNLCILINKVYNWCRLLVEKNWPWSLHSASRCLYLRSVFELMFYSNKEEFEIQLEPFHKKNEDRRERNIKYYLRYVLQNLQRHS